LDEIGRFISVVCSVPWVFVSAMCQYLAVLITIAV
jgi:hypothetical protein